MGPESGVEKIAGNGAKRRRAAAKMTQPLVVTSFSATREMARDALDCPSPRTRGNKGELWQPPAGQ
jgi:hypothetical protein